MDRRLDKVNKNDKLQLFLLTGIDPDLLVPSGPSSRAKLFRISFFSGMHRCPGNERVIGVATLPHRYLTPGLRDVIALLSRPNRISDATLSSLIRLCKACVIETCV